MSAVYPQQARRRPGTKRTDYTAVQGDEYHGDHEQRAPRRGASSASSSAPVRVVRVLFEELGEWLRWLTYAGATTCFQLLCLAAVLSLVYGSLILLAPADYDTVTKVGQALNNIHVLQCANAPPNPRPISVMVAKTQDNRPNPNKRPRAPAGDPAALSYMPPGGGMPAPGGGGMPGGYAYS